MPDPPRMLPLPRTFVSSFSLPRSACLSHSPHAMSGVPAPLTQDVQRSRRMITTLLATLPTQDFLGHPFKGSWAGLAWARGLDKALAEAIVTSSDDKQSLVALKRTLMYLDYTLWSGRWAETLVVSPLQETIPAEKC